MTVAASLAIAIPVVSCASSKDFKAIESTSPAASEVEGGAFSSKIPTVSVETDEPQRNPEFSLNWNAPQSPSDFTLEWVQFVMNEYWTNQSEDKEDLNLASKIENFKVNMAGSPNDDTTPTRG